MGDTCPFNLKAPLSVQDVEVTQASAANGHMPGPNGIIFEVAFEFR